MLAARRPRLRDRSVRRLGRRIVHPGRLRVDQRLCRLRLRLARRLPHSQIQRKKAQSWRRVAFLLARSSVKFHWEEVLPRLDFSPRFPQRAKL